MKTHDPEALVPPIEGGYLQYVVRRMHMAPCVMRLYHVVLHGGVYHVQFY